MTELHGWLAVRETYGDEDELPQYQLESITRKVKEIVSGNEFGVELQSCNGSLYITTLFCSNHRNAEIDGIISVYKSIAETAAGSYGMIWLWDDEDAVHHNEFQVFVFKRGKCLFRTDTDLSPCIPVIEDGTE